MLLCAVWREGFATISGCMVVDAGCIDFGHTLGWSGRTKSQFRVLEVSRYSLWLEFCLVWENLPSKSISTIRTPINDLDLSHTRDKGDLFLECVSLRGDSLSIWQSMRGHLWFSYCLSVWGILDFGSLAYWIAVFCLETVAEFCSGFSGIELKKGGHSQLTVMRCCFVTRKVLHCDKVERARPKNRKPLLSTKGQIQLYRVQPTFVHKDFPSFCVKIWACSQICIDE